MNPLDDLTPSTRGASAMERINTVFVLAESVRQVGRIAAAPRGGPDPARALLALLPVARGLAATRLLLGRPGRLERAVLSALVAGVGAALSAYPELTGPAEPEADAETDAEGGLPAASMIEPTGPVSVGPTA